MEEIIINSEFIKLDALLKYASLVGSGGEAKYVISENMVTVNNEICTQRGRKIRNGDIVVFSGQKLKVIYES